MVLVPTSPFEHEGGLGDHFFDLLLAAFWTDRDGVIGHFLNDFELMLTVRTAILIDGHGQLPERCFQILRSLYAE